MLLARRALHWHRFLWWLWYGGLWRHGEARGHLCMLCACSVHALCVRRWGRPNPRAAVMTSLTGAAAAPSPPSACERLVRALHECALVDCHPHHACMLCSALSLPPSHLPSMATPTWRSSAKDRWPVRLSSYLRWPRRQEQALPSDLFLSCRPCKTLYTPSLRGDASLQGAAIAPSPRRRRPKTRARCLLVAGGALNG